MADSDAFKVLGEALAGRGIDVEAVAAATAGLAVETPSWAYADGGTRFKVFHQRGAARNVFEKLADAACVHRLTGAAPSVAVHVLWDFAEASPAAARDHAAGLGLRIGAVNPTLFERDEYRFGSLANPRPAVRQKALAHVLDSIEVMRACGSKYLSVWLADGTDYPGQDDFRRRRARLAEGLRKVHDALDEGMEMLLEYKTFEPAFYATDIADWGGATLLARAAGPKAKVLVDLGHHPHGTNIEQIVAVLIDEGMLGGFHFNSRKYADDDLTTGSMDPYELFLIFSELVAAARRDGPESGPGAEGPGLYDAAYMIDESPNVKPRIEAMIQSVTNIQETFAKALCVDRKALRAAQEACDVVAAENLLKRAFFTDVTPLLAAVRERRHLPADPLAAYRASGYQRKIESQRS